MENQRHGRRPRTSVTEKNIHAVFIPVSYTQLDVYKRQSQVAAAEIRLSNELKTTTKVHVCEVAADLSVNITGGRSRD